MILPLLITEALQGNLAAPYTDETTGAQRLVGIVSPQEADDGDRVSVLAPVGTALIGLSAGQAIDGDFPDGDEKP